MKHIYLLLFMLIPMTGMAQEGISQDTTLYVNGRKILIKENEAYYGVVGFRIFGFFFYLEYVA